MPKFLNAPQGERNPVDGTEVAPLGSADGLSSWWASLSTVRTFVKSLTDTLYSAYNHTHADSDNGGVVNHTVLTNAGTSIHLPAYSSDSTTYLDGNGNWTVPPGGLSSVYDSDILFTDNTVNNSSSDEHGFLPKLNGDTNYFLNGAGAWATPPAGGTVYDSDVVFSDTTANNADSDMHGFLPKLSGDSDTWLDGKGAWTTPATGSGAMTFISEATPSGTGTISFTSIPGTYRALVIILQGRSTQAATIVQDMAMEFNTDTTATNYRSNYTESYSNGSLAGSGANDRIMARIPAASAPANSAAGYRFEIPYYAETTFTKIANSQGAMRYDASGTDLLQLTHSMEWENTAAITQIDLKLPAGNWVTGTKAALYGVS